MKKKEVKTSKKKEVKEDKKSINKKTIALLYLLCSICWLVSGFFELKADSNGTFSFIVGGALFALAIVYFYLHKKSLK